MQRDITTLKDRVVILTRRLTSIPRRTSDPIKKRLGLMTPEAGRGAYNAVHDRTHTLHTLQGLDGGA